MFRRYNFPRLGIIIAVLAALLAMLAVVLHRFEAVGFQISLPMLAVSALSGLLAVVLSAIGLITAWQQQKSVLPVLAGLLLGLIVAAPTILTMLSGSGVPRIHDITTDIDNPPEFKAVLALRTHTDNTLDRKSPENLTQLQQEAYPALKPLLLDRSRDIVFTQALQLAKSHGWKIAAASADKGTIEATATTPIMAFKDDVVIRIQSVEDKTRVDMRSVSRVGLSDLGANAARIQQFMNELSTNL